MPGCRRFFGAAGTALSSTLLLLLLLAAPPRSAAQASCSTQLASVPGATTEWVDADTPPSACTKQLCTADAHETCVGAAPPLTSMQLVFSDEFADAGRSMAVGAGDKRWTAENLWYAGTQDMEVYAAEQVTTAGGAATITMEKEQGWGPTQRDNGTVWNVTKDYKSGFFSSWNKFCFTGGYVEAGLQFPGDDYISGFWPAFWLMGNLARPGYLATTGGFWPYTYDACGGGDAGLSAAGANKPQRLSACPDPPGFDRTKYGMQPGVGRGAPEIDLVEMKVPPSIDEQTGEPIPLGLPRGGRPGQHPNAFNSMTLQSGPLLPNGTTWMDVNNGNSTQGPLGEGMWLPQEAMKPGGSLDGMWTHATYWTGDFAFGMLDDLRALYPEAKAQDMLQNIRPGNVVQDSVSVMATLNSSHFTSYHKFGLDWKPKTYIRWYIDDVLVYEVDQAAVRAQGNGTYDTAERLIPVEAMFIIFNFAMSNSFTAVDLDRLEFPAEYKIDYVRVYQDPAAINVGCSPKAFPTEQWIACNRDSYVITQADQALIPATCQQLPTCRSEVGYELQGGDLYLNSDRPAEVPGVASPQECCKLCQDEPKCGAWTWKPYFNLTCAFKRPTGWTRARMPKEYEGFFSGVVYDAGSSTPRGESSPPSAAQHSTTAAVAWRVATLGVAAGLALLLL